MATNPYFSNGQSHDAVYREQDLIDSMTQEAIQIHGQNMIYCPRTLVKEDYLLGEDTISAFTKPFTIEMYINSVNSFGGDGDFLGKFGVQVNDDVELIVSRTRFNVETQMDHPNEGDLIYFPLSKSLFEIKFVEHENPFYQLGKLYTFKLSCQLYQYSHEEFNTGIPDIDQVVSVTENVDDIIRDDYADNPQIENEAEEILDFSEHNPFGKIGGY